MRDADAGTMMGGASPLDRPVSGGALPDSRLSDFGAWRAGDVEAGGGAVGYTKMVMMQVNGILKVIF